MPVVIPGLVIGSVKILWSVNPGVIHEDIDARGNLQQGIHAISGAEIGNRRPHLHAGYHLLKLLNSPVDRVDAASVNNHFSAAFRQSSGDGEANTAR